VKSWGKGSKAYKPTPQHQANLRQLLAKFPYRLDTNYAKMDRIQHTAIEAFKERIGRKKLYGMSVNEWTRILTGEDDDAIREAVKVLRIKDSGTSALVH